MIGMNKGVAAILGAGSYSLWFLIAGFLHIVALLILSPLWRRGVGATPDLRRAGAG